MSVTREALAGKYMGVRPRRLVFAGSDRSVGVPCCCIVVCVIHVLVHGRVSVHLSQDYVGEAIARARKRGMGTK